ncbi:predicted protein [Scheffersomyces stipitis CBS 6054]|uniref:Pre-mRNA-splicing factor SYF2 n=1 Tax=Scheffersomyces stipitis (strain ATCC 58785 / CBS 6054 / NBRC 10063 / NRRL Y-11545) TaxID=322104 RepID=A3LY59_PICST|nr:predicted protein [Scheffersomyces stipitis CBS 6054]ABN67579.2 predicted protein [Scheffersomyces stipitis CBS 6054]KAG2732289.1 hypothetical protein G9P44_004706 [Scheffersomyces stipitis]
MFEISKPVSEKDKNVISENLKRLEELRRRKKESQVQNSIEASIEWKTKKLAAKKQPKDLEEDDENEALHEGPQKDKLDYTLLEWEEWDKKMSNSKFGRKGYSNMNELAKWSYEKEMEALEVDKVEYNKQKQKLELQNSANAVERDIAMLKVKPSQEAVASLVQNLQESNERKQKRRRNKQDEEAVSSYINEKNRDFNMKLNREYS